MSYTESLCVVIFQDCSTEPCLPFVCEVAFADFC